MKKSWIDEYNLTTEKRCADQANANYSGCGFSSNCRVILVVQTFLGSVIPGALTRISLSLDSEADQSQLASLI